MIKTKFKNQSVHKRSGFIIGASPIFNPCDECLVKITCNQNCDDKILFELNKKRKNPPLKLKFKRKNKK